MAPFQFVNYKVYLIARIEQMPRKGRGQILAIAQALSVHSTLISQTLRGNKKAMPIA